MLFTHTTFNTLYCIKGHSESDMSENGHNGHQTGRLSCKYPIMGLLIDLLHQPPFTADALGGEWWGVRYSRALGGRSRPTRWATRHLMPPPHTHQLFCVMHSQLSDNRPNCPGSEPSGRVLS